MNNHERVLKNHINDLIKRLICFFKARSCFLFCSTAFRDAFTKEIIFRFVFLRIFAIKLN